METETKIKSSRTKIERAFARKLLKRPPGKFEQLDLTQHPNAPGWMTRCYRNNRYTVMIADNIVDPFGKVASRAMIQRHDDMPIQSHWSEIQSIKNAIYGADAMGYECYPPQNKLTNKANIYWLWVPKSEVER